MTLDVYAVLFDQARQAEWRQAMEQQFGLAMRRRNHTPRRRDLIREGAAVVQGTR